MLAADCPSGRRPLSAGKHRKNKGTQIKASTSVRLTTVSVLVVDFAFVGVSNTSWSIFIFLFQVHPE